LLSDTRMAFTDGIFPGLSNTCRLAAREFLSAAKKQGCMTCFDVNYRAHLWNEDSAREAWEELLESVDILVTGRDVSERVFGFSGSDEDLMRAYSERFGCRVVCLTSREVNGLQQGAWSSRAYCEGSVFDGGRIEFSIVDRYGTGDAWFAGFLHAYLSGDIGYALRYGNAVCALAHTIEGDIAHLRDDDVTAVMSGDLDLRVKR
ncbi:MAG TPA: PfkB family carbohydrate kinase, partial [Armatimonadota bacterium]|nr:PfkB family carbohydrate kinase [Armatimonadota bacterium]